MRRFAQRTDGSEPATAQGPLRLQDFRGDWSLLRDIADHRSGTAGRFEGTARFTPAGAGLDYVETGLLTMAGQPPMQAERRYVWRSEDGRFVVAFADGRPFHDFTPSRPEASHWCDPDSYRVTYDFSAWPLWTGTWRVSGPRKDYEMISSYRPVAR